MATPRKRIARFRSVASKTQVPKALVSESLGRVLRIIAQDPTVQERAPNGKPSGILTAQVTVARENIAPGPCGYRVHVIDFDASTQTLYAAREGPFDADPYEKASDETLVSDPGFHAQNVYAIVMRTLGAFEFALGRRLSWAFDSHQLQVAPHAFSVANAFYSRRDQALMFGYFHDASGTPVFTCLSHDVIAHETTHALLDGLRERYMDPSSIDQVAFHEGFADVVALLSVFSLQEIVSALLSSGAEGPKRPVISADLTTQDALANSALLGLAEQLGTAMPGSRGDALRRSVLLEPDPKILDREDFEEEHRRGEVFVAAMMRAFVRVWHARLLKLGFVEPGMRHLERVTEDGAKAAKHLMTMAIRALDYCPPTALTFDQYLAALLEADEEIQPDDSIYHYRDALRKSFAEYGIRRSKARWKLDKNEQDGINYRRTHFESMQRDPDEVFRFVWENRAALQLHETAYTKVISVRPCTRLSADGFILRETVAEYLQLANLTAGELRDAIGRDLPEGTDEGDLVRLYGGGTLIFDDYGRLKYHARNPVIEPGQEQKRLKELWDRGYFESGAVSRFSQLHLSRETMLPRLAPKEETAW